MKYLYKDGFDFGHWVFQLIGIFISSFTIVLKILTVNLIYFDFEVKWIIYSLKNQKKLTLRFNRIIKTIKSCIKKN